MGENLQGIFWNFEICMWFLYYDLLSYEFNFLFIKLLFFFPNCFAIQCFECWNMSVLVFIAAFWANWLQCQWSRPLDFYGVLSWSLQITPTSQISLLSTKCVYFVLWYKQRVYLYVYNCGLQFSFSHTMKYFKEYAWNCIYLAKRSVCCFHLWNQVFIRLLYESHSTLGAPVFSSRHLYNKVWMC